MGDFASQKGWATCANAATLFNGHCDDYVKTLIVISRRHILWGGWADQGNINLEAQLTRLRRGSSTAWLPQHACDCCIRNVANDKVLYCLRLPV